MDMMALNVRSVQLIVSLVIQHRIVRHANQGLPCLMEHVMDVVPNVQYVNSISMKLNSLTSIDA